MTDTSSPPDGRTKCSKPPSGTAGKIGKENLRPKFPTFTNLDHDGGAARVSRWEREVERWDRIARARERIERLAWMKALLKSVKAKGWAEVAREVETGIRIIQAK